MIFIPRTLLKWGVNYEEEDDGFWFNKACSIALVRGTASMPAATASDLWRSLLEASRRVSNIFFFIHHLASLCYSPLYSLGGV